MNKTFVNYSIYSTSIIIFLGTRICRRFGILLDGWIRLQIDLWTSLPSFERSVSIFRVDIHLFFSKFFDSNYCTIKIISLIHRLSEGPLVTAYFTHSGTILKLLALLGVARDDQPLTHDLFSLYADNRAWRTGFIDAFASNIAFVLYK